MSLFCSVVKVLQLWLAAAMEQGVQLVSVAGGCLQNVVGGAVSVCEHFHRLPCTYLVSIL